MEKRWTAVLIPGALFAALGFLLGVEDWRLCAAFALRRFDGWGADLPMPRAMLWASHLRGGLGWVQASKFTIPIATVMLTLLGLWTLARLMDPHFALLEPKGDPPAPEEDPYDELEHRPQTNIDVRRWVRFLGGSLVTLWLLGAFISAATLWDGLPNKDGALKFFWSLPNWVGSLPPAFAVLVHGLVLGAAVWTVWSPHGPFGKRSGLLLRDLAWGLLAGVAAAPALLLLYHARYLAQGMRQTVNLADGGGWQQLLLWVLLAPALAGAWLGLVAFACRPRPFTHRFMSWFGAVAVVAAVAGALGHLRVVQEERMVGFTGLNLAKTLHLQPASGRRRAILFAPDGTALFSAPEDGSNDQQGDRIACNPDSVERVHRFLLDHRFNTLQAFRAYIHLFDCAALEWKPDQGIGYSLETLEHAPSPVAAQVLKQQLSECAVTPESRKALDMLADPQRFRWPEPLGQRWLGVAYMRFGDVDRARGYLLHAGLDQTQLRGMLGGVQPLSAGTVTGRVRVNGAAAKTRVGLVRLESARTLPGGCPPFEWRHVAAATETDVDGRFTLRGVAEGNYLLLVSGAPVQEHRAPPKGSKVGVIRLDRFHPAANLGSVTLDFPDVVPAPPGENGTRTQTARA